MTPATDLLLDSLTPAGWRSPVHLAVPGGSWTTLLASDPDTLINVLAGTAPAPGGVVLAGRELGGLAPHERARNGLVTVTCRLPDLAGLRVVDVVLLGRPAGRRMRWWQLAAGTRAARTAQLDTEAAVRNLGGRLGLARWMDRDAVELPPAVAALADTLRGLAASPSALVWRRPQWLPAPEAAALAEAVDGERRRLGFTVLEVVAGGAS